MPRATAAERRKQLIEATVIMIHEKGFCEVRIDDIAERAGVSHGLAHRYFGTRAGLLNATMRHLLDTLKDEALPRFRNASTPVQRVRAVVDSQFAASQLAPELISVWLAFYTQSKISPDARRLLKIYQNRLFSNLHYAFRQMVSQEEAEVRAAGVAAVIDGLWMDLVVREHHVDPEAARLKAHAIIDKFLAD